MKICSKCGIEKNKSEFSKQSASNDGLQSRCKSCVKLHNSTQKEYKAVKQKEWNLKNLDYKKEENKKYQASHKKERADYMKKRAKENILFALSGNIRCLIRISFTRNGFSKNSKAEEILGCTFSEFKVHLENQFVDGMSWSNRGLWHLDHIYPVSKALNEEHLIALNHYTNFQPLWAEDNIRKGNKILEEFS